VKWDPYIYTVCLEGEFDAPLALGTRVCLKAIQGVGSGKAVMTGMNFEVKDILLQNWGACVDVVLLTRVKINGEIEPARVMKK
jgi:hypothetical protein